MLVRQYKFFQPQVARKSKSLETSEYISVSFTSQVSRTHDLESYSAFKSDSNESLLINCWQRTDNIHWYQNTNKECHRDECHPRAGFWLRTVIVAWSRPVQNRSTSFGARTKLVNLCACRRSFTTTIKYSYGEDITFYQYKRRRRD